MFRTIAAVMALLSVPAVTAAPAAQFNLTCSGTQSTKSIEGETSEPYTSTYRIDLDRKKWCEGDCKALHDIASVQPTQLTLETENVDTVSERSTLSNIVDRETGTHKISATSSTPRAHATAITLNWDGRCEPALFSGFPDVPTKF